jgi:hypothetical protein
LDNLGTGRTVALCASVFGRRLKYAHLRELLDLDDSALAPAIESLTKAQILVQIGEIPDASLEFRHTLLRDTAYHTLLKSERERWHRRIAQLAAVAAPSIERSTPELLATHHSLGGSYKEAVEYWLRAHSQAMLRSANVEALGHVRSGLEDCKKLATQEPYEAKRLELELLRKLAAPLIAVSGWSTPELEGVYERAGKLCDAIGSEEVRFELDRGRYNLHLLRSELQAADAISDRLIKTAEAARDPGVRENYLLVALRSKALPPFYGGRYPEARSLLNQMMSLYDPVKHKNHAFQFGTEAAVLALSYLAWIDGVNGHVERSSDQVEEALDRARVVGHAFSTCYALCFGASCAQVSGDVERAAGLSDAAFREANRHNFQYWLAWASAVRGWARGLEAPSEGIAIIQQAKTSYLATGSTLVTPYFEALACDIAQSADLDDSRATERTLRAQAETTGLWFWEAALRRRQSQ